MDASRINNGRNPVWDELLSSGRGQPNAPAVPAEVEIPVALPKSGIVVTLSTPQGVKPIVPGLPDLPDLPVAAPPRIDRPPAPNPAATPARDAQLLARAIFPAGDYAAPLTPPRPPSAPPVPEPATPRGLPRELAPLLARRQALEPALTSATARATGLASVLAHALAPEPAPGRPGSPALAPGLPPAFTPAPGTATTPGPAYPPSLAAASGLAAALAPASTQVPATAGRRSERSADDALPNFFAAAPARAETSVPGSPVPPSQPAAPAEGPVRIDVPVAAQMALFSPASPAVARTLVAPENLKDPAALAPRASPEVMTHLLPRPQLPTATVPYLGRLIVGVVVLAVVLLLVF